MVDIKLLVDYLDELYPDAHCELNYRNNYELLIAVILSAQTTDKKVNIVTEVLFEKYPSFKELALAEYNEVVDIIRPLGLVNNKAKNIIETAKRIMSDYNGIIPVEREELLQLPGVGEKVCAVFLGDAFGFREFPVDTHVKRISKRLELSSHEDPTKISEDLKKVFSEYDFMKLHHQLIFFGRYFCTSRNPNCKNCIFRCQKR